LSDSFTDRVGQYYASIDKNAHPSILQKIIDLSRECVIDPAYIEAIQIKLEELTDK
jgi:hypothetical protein